VFDEKHEGLDFGVQKGILVQACRDGRVVWASNQRRIGGDSLLGNHIIIEHADGWTTWYGHLKDILSGVGDVVKRGDVIGEPGSTGKSSGPHLHLIAQHKGYGLSGFIVPDVVNPLDYLR
jgi:murein DD-endopeptidase MepM/ murein hydrolase activator NlpD